MKMTMEKFIEKHRRKNARLKATKYDLMFCALGNGTTVCNKLQMQHGDYKNIAHISEDGYTVKWYVPFSSLPDNVWKAIEDFANKITQNISG